MKLYTKWTRLLIMNESLSIPVFYFVLFTQKKRVVDVFVKRIDMFSMYVIIISWSTAIPLFLAKNIIFKAIAEFDQ